MSLPGFEIETQPLTEDEKKILPVIVKALLKKNGADNAVTNKQIRAGLLRNLNTEIADSRIRKIINHIRMNNMVPGLLASSKGYYVSTNAKEVKEYIDSLEGREKAIRGIKEKAKQYLNQIITMDQKELFI